MSLPIFYLDTPAGKGAFLTLPEEASRHIVQVLRMKTGERIRLADGRGQLLVAAITDDHKKKCTVQVLEAASVTPPARRISIGISLLKNNSRLEWFLEKATEIGVTEIIPLLCERTERQHFRHDRMNSILISAMLQSQQAWLPVLHEPVAFPQLFRLEDIGKIPQRLIAHCEPAEKQSLTAIPGSDTRLLLIGPEGDFTPEEIALALEHGFVPVSLGETRLRTETAGVVAAALLKMGSPGQ
ncbi:MAG: RsmE family RNA methyltransferase [Candidatus Pseudobacter hemicellulosilyticus]|uniref:Ribosomal RNA small subunit methyltransferase E n=1 Tax=Candidatus Pseudobacter hemicellulosilyticus TaxID=3121375 RepID=A0AAJ6BIR7_9BACT|nr:MAG: RsmE family RNA methyltransferase [Pseudobacter sp.]